MYYIVTYHNYYLFYYLITIFYSNKISGKVDLCKTVAYIFYQFLKIMTKIKVPIKENMITLYLYKIYFTNKFGFIRRKNTPQY